jgi:hypothetical protein
MGQEKQWHGAISNSEINNNLLLAGLYLRGIFLTHIPYSEKLKVGL